jgi:hypothetical protein
MTVREFHGYYYLMYKDLSTADGKKKLENNTIEDAMEDLVDG